MVADTKVPEAPGHGLAGSLGGSVMYSSPMRARICWRRSSSSLSWLVTSMNSFLLDRRRAPARLDWLCSVGNLVEFVEAGLEPGNLAIDEDGANDGGFGFAGGDVVAVVFFPHGQDADVAEFDANAGGAVVLANGGEEADHFVARVAILVGHEAVDVGARLVGEEIAERIKDDGVAAVGGAVGLDGLEDVGMVADDDGGSGVEHLVGDLDIFRARARWRTRCPSGWRPRGNRIGRGRL